MDETTRLASTSQCICGAPFIAGAGSGWPFAGPVNRFPKFVLAEHDKGSPAQSDPDDRTRSTKKVPGETSQYPFRPFSSRAPQLSC